MAVCDLELNWQSGACGLWEQQWGEFLWVYSARLEDGLQRRPPLRPRRAGRSGLALRSERACSARSQCGACSSGEIFGPLFRRAARTDRGVGEDAGGRPCCKNAASCSSLPQKWRPLGKASGRVQVADWGLDSLPAPGTRHAGKLPGEHPGSGPNRGEQSGRGKPKGTLRQPRLMSSSEEGSKRPVPRPQRGRGMAYGVVKPTVESALPALPLAAGSGPSKDIPMQRHVTVINSCSRVLAKYTVKRKPKLGKVEFSLPDPSLQ
ncbi:uncharacterized protein LOC134153481 [Rhea pennata]|uniref:uncharacterized protein LOC134153481 n=1 Tax=Rhea pennata TaxID=8795 RepID=UPI002E262DD4